MFSFTPKAKASAMPIPKPDATRHALLAEMSGRPVALVVFEATGGYERALRQTLANEDVPHACVQPTRVRRFIEAHGHAAKTDRLDAQALARFGAAGLAMPSARQSADLLALRDLMRTLAFIRKQMATLKCQMEKIGGQGGGPQCLAALLETGKTQEQVLLETIAAHVASSDRLKTLVDLLVSMPGIGLYTATTVVAELPELGTCSKAEIAALVGIAPFTRDSGKRKGQAAIRGGRHYARKALYMAAITAMRFNPVFKTLYQELRNRGKCFKVAIVAVMRKMAIALNAMAKNNQPWNLYRA